MSDKSSYSYRLRSSAAIRCRMNQPARPVQFSVYDPCVDRWFGGHRKDFCAEPSFSKISQRTYQSSECLPKAFSTAVLFGFDREITMTGFVELLENDRGVHACLKTTDPFPSKEKTYKKGFPEYRNIVVPRRGLRL